MKRFLNFRLGSVKIIFLFVFLLSACGIIRPVSKSNNTVNIEPARDTLNKYYHDSAYVYKIDSSKTNNEFIDWNLVRINGKLPMITNTKDLYKLLGQPDSIVTPNYDDVSVRYYDLKEFKYAYIKESQFEIYGDTAVISFLNFEKQPDLEFKAGTLTLNHNTTIAELKKLFPKAMKEMGEINVYQTGKFMCIRLETSKYMEDDAWLLFFRKDKLVRIDFWMPD
jgi:hypothetical protein